MSTPYLFDNAVLDRHAKLANGLPVEGEFEFADRLVWLASFPNQGPASDDELLDTFLDRKAAIARLKQSVQTPEDWDVWRCEDCGTEMELPADGLVSHAIEPPCQHGGYQLVAMDERGGVGYGVLLIVACLGLFGWGWTHSSTSPNGATLLGVLMLAVVVLIIRTFARWYRRTERAGAAHTKRREELTGEASPPLDYDGARLVLTSLERNGFAVVPTDDGAAVAAQSMGGSLPPAAPSSLDGPGPAVIGGQPGPVPRRFELYRHTDISQVSGTGVVAEGCEFTDGSVALRWRGDHPATAVWPSLADVLAVHGHQGATEVTWFDGPIDLWPAEGGDHG